MRWFLLRGLVREQRHWLGFPAYFAAHVRSPDGAPTTVITLDLPGFGSENDAPVPRTIAGFVDDLRERLRRSMMRPALRHLRRVARRHGRAQLARGVLRRLRRRRHRQQSDRRSLPPWERMRAANWPRVLLAPLLPLRVRERMLLGMTRYQGDLDADADQYAAIAVAAPAAPRRRRPDARRAGDEPRANRRPATLVLYLPFVIASCRGAAASASPSGSRCRCACTRARSMPPVTICPSTIQRGLCADQRVARFRWRAPLRRPLLKGTPVARSSQAPDLSGALHGDANCRACLTPATSNAPRRSRG